MKKLLAIIVILSCLLLITYVFYNEHQSHVDAIKKLEDRNKKHIKEIEVQFQKEINLMDRVILDKEGRIMELQWDIDKLNNYLGVQKIKNNVKYLIENSPDFVVTAYDLSIQSCGKSFTNRSYGITANGTNLRGLDLRGASTISTDPRIIPLGTIVYLYFENENAKKYNGLFISNDTGSAIKGNKIDLFFGDFNSETPNKNALSFGKQMAKVIKLE